MDACFNLYSRTRQDPVRHSMYAQLKSQRQIKLYRNTARTGERGRIGHDLTRTINGLLQSLVRDTDVGVSEHSRKVGRELPKGKMKSSLELVELGLGDPRGGWVCRKQPHLYSRTGCFGPLHLVMISPSVYDGPLSGTSSVVYIC